MTTIPAAAFVRIVPGVVGAGGSALDLTGIALSAGPRVPIGEVLSFPSAPAVAAYFGASSPHAANAAIYFNGFTNSNSLPGNQLWAQYNQAPVAAWLRGGTFTLTLAQMQALSGSLTVVMDGYSHGISSISLSSYNSPSAAATAIAAAFTDPTEASYTASMGASFTASAGSPTTQVAITAVTGYISIGDVVSGTGFTTDTTITGFISGVLGGAGTYSLSQSNTTSAASCTSTSTVMDVTVCATPSIAVGQTVVNGSLTGSPIIASQISGAIGGVGLYQLSGVRQSVASGSFTSAATAPLVTFDSISNSFTITSGIAGAPSTAAFATGTLAGSLNLTQATGAILSQGAAAQTPSAFMSSIVALTQDWASFQTDFDPDQAVFIGSTSSTTLTVSSIVAGTIIIGDTLNAPGVLAGTIITAGSGLSWTISQSQNIALSNMSSFAGGGGHGNTQKQAFAAWTTLQDDRYAYICWDTDITPTESVPATGSLGYILQQNASSGICLIYDPNLYSTLAPFICGSIASIDFTEKNGNITFAYKSQAGLLPTVTNETIAFNLGGNPQSVGDYGNGYNYYAASATANQAFQWFQRGAVTGQYLWLDAYVDQIWLSNALQLAIMEGLSSVKSAPYAPPGYALLDAWCMDPINQGLNFGAITPGITLSAAQIAEINNAAGLNIAPIVQTRGWYLQITPAIAQVRAARSSPPCTLWYAYGGSIQALSLNSVEVQ